MPKYEQFEGIYTEIERHDKIKKEVKRLNKSLVDLDNKRKITLKKLIEEIAFLSVTLEETRQIIIRDGIIEKYQNGANQHGVKRSAAVDVYDRFITSYSKIINQINKALPDDSKINASDDILNFALGAKGAKK